MKQELPAAAQKAFKLLSSLPPLPDVITSTTHAPCVACGRQKHLIDFKVYNSGVVNNVTELTPTLPSDDETVIFLVSESIVLT